MKGGEKVEICATCAQILMDDERAYQEQERFEREQGNADSA